jgi:hypothetical protein
MVYVREVKTRLGILPRQELTSTRFERQHIAKMRKLGEEIANRPPVSPEKFHAQVKRIRAGISRHR